MSLALSPKILLYVVFLWAEDYFPVEWFSNEKIDEEEKFHERASMTARRKERILWLAVRIARSSGSGLNYYSG